MKYFFSSLASRMCKQTLSPWTPTHVTSLLWSIPLFFYSPLSCGEFKITENVCVWHNLTTVPPTTNIVLRNNAELCLQSSWKESAMIYFRCDDFLCTLCVLFTMKLKKSALYSWSLRRSSRAFTFLEEVFTAKRIFVL